MILTFFPYLGVPVGKNSSIQAGTFLAVALMPKIWGQVKLRRVLFIVFCALLANLIFAVMQDASQVNLGAYPIFMANLLPAFLVAEIAISRPRKLIAPIRFCLLFTSVYAIVQKFVFLDRGELPFLSYYDLPGFASVASKLQVITTYVKRPFAFFPEPSFMAATILLASVGLLILLLVTGAAKKMDLLLLGLVGVVMYLSGSGSAVFGLGALVVLATLTIAPRYFRLPVLTLGGIASVFVAEDILAQRSRAFNWSWDDRSASIYAAFEYWAHDVYTFLFGVGQGRLTTLFTSGKIDLGGYRFFNEIPDMYSVLGRTLIEFGLILGSMGLLWLSIQIFKSLQVQGNRSPWVSGALAVVTWAVAGGLTTSYQAALWIWLLPMLAWAVRLSTDGEKNSRSSE